MQLNLCFFFFFFNDTATTEIYTLSLHDALPICLFGHMAADLLSDERHILAQSWRASARRWLRSLKDAVSSRIGSMHGDRKSTRLNSSHLVISYAVFCLKKKKHASTNLPRRQQRS